VRRNLTTWRTDPTSKRGRSAADELDRIRELETENALLRARVADLNRRIDEQVVAAAEELATPDEDGSMEAFEAFLSEDDPHIDRVQRFLLG
jgi:hypothetical protein